MLSSSGFLPAISPLPPNSILYLSETMEASIGPPCLPTTPTTEPDIEKIKQKLLRGGVTPTPKIIHTLRKKELQKLNRRLAKQPLPLLTDSQKQALAEDSHFRTIKSEYRNLTKQLKSGKKMVGRPWERLEKLQLRELASETKEYTGDNLKMEHLKELSDIMDDERGKLQWLLEDDVEVDEGWLEQENTSNVVPPKRSRTEAETIRFFLERWFVCYFYTSLCFWILDFVCILI